MGGNNDTVTYSFRKFNPRWIKKNSRLAFIGKTMTGKTTLVFNCLYHHRDIGSGVCISGTDDGVENYSKIMPEIAVYEKYDKHIIKRLIQQQKKKRQIKKKHYEKKFGRRLTKQEWETLTKPSPVYLIMDDCLYGKEWTKDEDMRYIFMNGRHNQIFFFLTMQYPLGIPPELRTQLDYVFILRENITNNRKKIFENFAGMFPNLNVFSNVMDSLTEDYHCLVIANNAQSNRIEDQVFWYKAEIHDDFTIGSKEFWRFSEKYFNEEYDSRENEIQEEIDKVVRRYGPRKQKVIIEKKG